MDKYKSYMISTMGLNGKARKARIKTLKETLNDFYNNEYIFIYEDGKCIFDGFKKDFDIKDVI